MSVKNIILIFMVLITIITTKNGNGIKSPLFNPISFLNEEKKMISFSDDTKIINIKCLYSKDYSMYSLQALQNKEEDYEITDKNGKKVFFNFCQNTNKNDDSTFVQIDGDKIIRLAGSIEGEDNKKNRWTKIVNETEELGLSIALVPGDKCGKGNHQTTVEIICDDSVDKYDEFVFSSNDTCTHLLKFKSVYGCALRSSYLFIKLLQDFKYVFCIIFVIVGVAVCFFGNRYLKYAIVIISAFSICYIATAALLNFFPNFITTELGLILCLVIFLVFGCVIGFILNKTQKLIVLVLGGFLGYASAKFVYQIVQNYVEFDPEVLYYICMIACIIVGAALGYFFADVIIIVSTSVFGGYVAMRGVSFVAEHYLDEGYIIDLIKSKEWEQLKEIRDGWTYAYLAMWLVLSAAGIFIQCKSNKKLKSDDIDK